MGLREKTKKITYHKILVSAKSLFISQGVDKTSMTEIAKLAEVGTGTIYNYFSSKGVLLQSIFADELKSLYPQEGKNPTNLLDELFVIIEKLVKFFNMYPKSFWRELLKLLPIDSDEASSFQKGILGLDYEFIEKIAKLFSNYEKNFIVPINIKDAALIIYSISLTQTFIFIYEDDYTDNQLLSNIKRQIFFVFEGKIGGKK